MPRSYQARIRGASGLLRLSAHMLPGRSEYGETFARDVCGCRQKRNRERWIDLEMLP